MPRDIPVGNGSLLVAFGKDYLIREFYFPFVGEENHTGESPFRMGVWVDGRFGWMPDGWQTRLDYLDDSLVTNVELSNENLKLKITVNDLVDFYENIFLRKLTVENLSDKAREVRLFLCHEFEIYGNDIGDTAAYRPEVQGILHYKGERYFLINIWANKKCGIDHFATGNRQTGGLDGTWKDAEDGVLSGNPIAQGSVDSVAAIHLLVGPGKPEECFYWICAGKNWEEVATLNKLIVAKKPETILTRTRDYWKLWIHKEELNYSLLPEKLAWLYNRSMLVIRTQINNTGSIIAANDSEVIHFNRDTYSYMWTRDAALVSYGLDLSGQAEITRNFFNLGAKLITPEGYFLHKYTPCGSMASSWQPWLKDNHPQLPIQEDETALVIWALWKHYVLFRDIEFIKALYKPLIKNAADFMMNYRDRRTRLPLASYDLWEERQGVHTFTTAAVYGGLTASANFAEAFGETGIAAEYRQGAEEVREGMDKYLYLENEKRFAKLVNFTEDGQRTVDSTVDASLFGIFAFGAYAPDDGRVTSTMDQVYEKLWCKTQVGGLARYEGDTYHRVSQELPGNPWFVTTLWLAQYYIARAKTKEELAPALGIMEWVAERALTSGVLAEQVNPYTDEPLSVSPLTWSHANFITAVHEYLDRLIEFDKCPACGQPKYEKIFK
jgi:glucoamylase